MRNLVLGFKRGSNKWSRIQWALESLGQSVDVFVGHYDEIEGPYDRIWTMAESLLPLQVELEKKWGLNNLSKRSADILSDKKKFDDMCTQLGFGDIVPDSVIPKTESDLNIFEDRPFIIKPIIGSGSKPGNLNYMSFKNKKDFLQSKYSKDFFITNNTGWKDTQFNNRRNYYMAQEQLPHDITMWAPYVYVNEKSKWKDVLWVKGKVTYHKIDEHRYETKPTEWMSVDVKEVPKDVVKMVDKYFTAIVKELNLKNWFFSGPDFYKYDDKLKYIDCNPRLGQGLQQMDDVHDSRILPKILKGKPFSYDKQFLWKVSKLKPGKIKSVKDLSHLKKYWCFTNNDRLRPGETIPDYVHIVSEKCPRVSFLITGVNESDMQKTYQTVNNQLQECIEYF